MDSSSAKLSRVEASEYLKRHHGIGHSAAYLAKLAVVGGGPKFSKANRAVIYAREHLDEYAAEVTSPAVRSTSELRTIRKSPPVVA